MLLVGERSGVVDVGVGLQAPLRGGRAWPGHDEVFALAEDAIVEGDVDGVRVQVDEPYLGVVSLTVAVFSAPLVVAAISVVGVWFQP